MNLLLLLSALFSALTGVAGGARVVQVPPAVSRLAASAAAAAVSTAHLTARPVQRAASIGASALAPIVTVPALSPAARLLTNRRRE